MATLPRQTAWQRAKQDTHFLSRPFLLRTAIPSGIAALVGLLGQDQWGSDTAAHDAFVAVVIGALTFGLLALAQFGFNLAAAPFRIQRERADAEVRRAEVAEAQLAALAAKDTEAKRELQNILREGALLREQARDALPLIGDALQPWITAISNWIFKAQLALENHAPEYLAYFLTDTGDMASSGVAATPEGNWQIIADISNRQLERLDRHLLRLNEIVYERL